MHPKLSEPARALLREGHLDVYSSPPAAVRELVQAGVLEPRGRWFAFTVLGARVLLDLLTSEALALPCRCGHTREQHGDVSPHPCIADAAEHAPRSIVGDALARELGARVSVTFCTCRSFTPARPIYRGVDS